MVQVIQTMEGDMLNESDLFQMLQQHGVALTADGLHTLRNFIKPAVEAAADQQQQSALGSDVNNGLVRSKENTGANILKNASVSLTLGNGQVIQLTEPFDTQQKVQFVPQLLAESQTAVQISNCQVTEAEMVQSNHGFQNEFLEDLARSQIVPDPKKVKSNKATPVRVAVKKKTEPKRKKANAKGAPTSDAATTTISDPNATIAAPVASAVPTAANSSCQQQQVVTTSANNTPVVQRVQTIKLSPQNQQVSRQLFQSQWRPPNNQVEQISYSI